MEQLDRAILSTIGYFDQLDYPLTAMEIHKWLFSDIKCSFENVVARLYLLGSKISCQDGLYFLLGREKILATRHDNYLSSIFKNKIVQKWFGYLARVPYVKMIAVCNNFSFNNLKESSDIHLFIVASSGRLYLVRFLLTAITSVLGLRRHDWKIANRFCLSFYLDDQNLNLENIQICHEDIYLKYWINTVLPVYDEGIFQDFCAENSWLDDSLSNRYSYNPGLRRRIEIRKMYGKKALEKFLSGKMGDWIEAIFKRIQLAKMSHNKMSLSKENDSRVIISDHMLKFHEGDRRLEYLEKFKEFITKNVQA